MATMRSSRVSRAFQTSPIPPSPSGARISYGPSLLPIVTVIRKSCVRHIKHQMSQSSAAGPQRGAASGELGAVHRQLEGSFARHHLGRVARAELSDPRSGSRVRPIDSRGRRRAMQMFCRATTPTRTSRVTPLERPGELYGRRLGNVKGRSVGSPASEKREQQVLARAEGVGPNQFRDALDVTRGQPCVAHRRSAGRKDAGDDARSAASHRAARCLA